MITHGLVAPRKGRKERHEEHGFGTTSNSALPAKKPLTIMVSSTVYGIEDMLNQVYALLSGFGYEVWCSHKGTVKVYPNHTALEDCLEAVRRCDLFLSIITPHYGSGKVGGSLSFTHQELLKAIQLNKPRWILSHDHVPFARSLLRKLGGKTTAQRGQLLRKLGFTTRKKLRNLAAREGTVIDDFRVIDMYDAAIRHDIKVYQDRQGNWVQKFSSPADAKLFVTAQFMQYADVKLFLHDQFKDPSIVRQQTQDRRNR